MNDIQVGDFVAIKYDDGSQSTVAGQVTAVTATTATLDDKTTLNLSRLVRTSPRMCECGMWPIEEYGRRCPSCPMTAKKVGKSELGGQLWKRADGEVVEVWYDVHIRQWTAFIVDEDGHQKGPAEYGFKDDVPLLIADAERGSYY